MRAMKRIFRISKIGKGRKEETGRVNAGKHGGRGERDENEGRGF